MLKLDRLPETPELHFYHRDRSGFGGRFSYGWGCEASNGARFGLSAASSAHAGPPDIAGIEVGVHDAKWGVGQERTSWAMELWIHARFGGLAKFGDRSLSSADSTEKLQKRPTPLERENDVSEAEDS